MILSIAAAPLRRLPAPASATRPATIWRAGRRAALRRAPSFHIRR